MTDNVQQEIPKEVVSPPKQDSGALSALWEQTVREEAKDICANCGGSDHTSVYMIIPEAAGGKKIPSNGVLLCRPCIMASGGIAVSTQKPASRRIVNFWASRGLYDKLHSDLDQSNRFSSASALVRFLMQFYCENEPRFEDLENYQDDGNDVKINAWVDVDGYSKFKKMMDDRGLTVTNGIKSLIVMYGQEGIPQTK